MTFESNLNSLVFAGLPARSLFREKVAIGTFLQNWVLKGSLLWVKSPYFTISYENNAYFLGKSFQFLLLSDLLLHILKPEAQKETELLISTRNSSKNILYITIKFINAFV